MTTHNTCDVFLFVFSGQMTCGFVFSFFSNIVGNQCIILGSLFCIIGLFVNVNSHMIIKGEKKCLKPDQYCYAAQKMWTEMFVVCGQIISDMSGAGEVVS